MCFFFIIIINLNCTKLLTLLTSTSENLYCKLQNVLILNVISCNNCCSLKLIFLSDYVKVLFLQILCIKVLLAEVNADICSNNDDESIEVN